MQAPAPQAAPEAQHAMSEETLAAPAPAPAETVDHAVAAELPAPVAAAEQVFVPEAAAPVVTCADPAPAAAGAEPIAPAAAIVDVEKALQQSGLVMIQTDPSKVKPAERMAEPRFVPPQPRPRRAPPPDTGPLQIVETRKDA